MTGYGEAQVELDGDYVRLELSSVNRRHRKIKFSLERTELERKVIKRIRESIERGTVEVSCESNVIDTEHKIPVVNEEMLDKYDSIFERMESSSSRVGGQVSPVDVLDLPGVVELRTEVPEQDRAEEMLVQAVDGALEQLIESRREEGSSIAEDLREWLDNISEYVDTIEARVPDALARYRESILESVESILELTGDEKEERLEKELKNYAEKCDISEEVSRIRSHIDQFENYLEETAPVGRSLEFLIQEIQREINTVGAKANDARISQLAVDVKSELEKCREQVRNLE